MLCKVVLYIATYKSKELSLTGQWGIFYTGSGVTLKVITDTIIWWKFQWKACERGLDVWGDWWCRKMPFTPRSLVQTWARLAVTWRCDCLTAVQQPTWNKGIQITTFWGDVHSLQNTQLQQISIASIWGASSSLRNCMDVVPRGTDSRQGLPSMHILHFVTLDVLAKWGCFPVKQMFP